MDVASTQKSSSSPLLLGIAFDTRVLRFIAYDTISWVFVIKLLKVEDGKD
jgi:hypothetical protein